MSLPALTSAALVHLTTFHVLVMETVVINSAKERRAFLVARLFWTNGYQTETKRQVVQNIGLHDNRYRCNKMCSDLQAEGNTTSLFKAQRD
jgi:uncharacterized membrane protein